MKGKYNSYAKFNFVRCQRGALRLLLRRLVGWEPLTNPSEGYTVLVGCTAQLSGMVGANLAMLQNQDRTHLEKIIVVMDRPKDEISHPLEKEMGRRFPNLPLQFIYYTPPQAKLLARIGWGWAYAWLSWSLATAQCRSRYALLQDFDAMLLRRDVLEERYRWIRQRQEQYVGTRWYAGGGVETSDRVVVTPEMVFDCAFVRERFRPIDLFNHVTMHHGRSVDFDTFLYAQATEGRASVLDISEEDMVHPSQMICQFTHLMSGKGTLTAPRNNLLLVPYFMYVGGEQNALAEQIAALRLSDGRTTKFFGRELAIGELLPAHVEWLRKQAERLEMALVGRVRPDVHAYFQQIEATLNLETLRAIPA